MKKPLLAFVMLFVGAMQLAAQNSLTVTLADGTQRVFFLSERPELLWEGDNIIISTATTELTVARTDLKGFSVSDASAIEAVRNGGSRFAIAADGTLQADGLKAGTVITIYDATGHQTGQQTVDANGHATVSLSHQPKGTYFIKTDHQPTLKIMKP